MKDLHFISALSMEEIVQNFSSINFFKSIMDGLEEALAYEKDKTAAATAKKT